MPGALKPPNPTDFWKPALRKEERRLCQPGAQGIIPLSPLQLIPVSPQTPSKLRNISNEEKKPSTKKTFRVKPR